LARCSRVCATTCFSMFISFLMRVTSPPRSREASQSKAVKSSQVKSSEAHRTCTVQQASNYCSSLNCPSVNTLSHGNLISSKKTPQFLDNMYRNGARATRASTQRRSFHRSPPETRRGSARVRACGCQR
jgi:hypothetical protein